MVDPDSIKDTSSTNGDQDEQKAEILQAMFQHYANVGLDHQRQSATTSNILLIIAGAILTVIGLDNQLNTDGDALGAAAIAIIGAFGMIWSWKQHETYAFWTNLAETYQRQLFKPFPELKLARELKGEVKAETAQEYGDITAYSIRIRYLWTGLHAVVMLLGSVFAVIILITIERQLVAVAVALLMLAIMILILTFVIDVFGFRTARAQGPHQE